MDTARADDTQFIRDHRSSSTLDKLAKEGIEYQNAFSTSPWTLPSHVSLFTGTYTSKHGTHADSRKYDGTVDTIAELLSRNGYETVGFTNNAWVTDEFGLAAGFDEFYKVWQYYQTDFDFGEVRLTTRGATQIKRALKGAVSGELFKNVVNAIYGGYLYRRNDYGAKRTNELATRWIRNRADDRPYFLFINYLEPHLDYQPPEEFADQYLPEDITYQEALEVPQNPWEFLTGALSLSQHELSALRALYRGELAYLDEQLGNLVSVLTEEEKARETVFVVVSDHGENIGDHGLMDHQYSVHDTLIHVPLIVSGSEFTADSPNEKLIQTVDVVPTLFDTVGINIDTDTQGLSFHPESDDKRSTAIAEYLAPQPSISILSERTGVPENHLTEFERQIRTIRTSTHKLVRYNNDTCKLFITDSETEESDVSSEYPTIANQLEIQLDTWLDSFEYHETGETVQLSETTRSRLEDFGYIT